MSAPADPSSSLSDHDLTWPCIQREHEGALTLQSSRWAMVDLALAPSSWWDACVAGFMGHPSCPVARAMDRLYEFSNANPEWGLSVYRTREGLRVLVTHAPLPTSSRLTAGALSAWGVPGETIDRLRRHGVYRVVLTPADSEGPGLARRAACHRLTRLGVAAVHPELSPWLIEHDHRTGAGTRHPLG